MFFSIITPCYNSYQYLDNYFISIKNQNFNDIEIIMVDDGSSDDTIKKIIKYQRYNNNITLVSLKHQGPLMARIVGINMAKGDYLLFVDSDDLLEPYTLMTIHDIIENNDKPDVIGFNSSRTFQSNIHNFLIEKVEKNDVWKYGGFGLWNKAYKKGLYNFDYITSHYSSLKINEDFLLSFELMKDANKILKIQKSLYIYQDNPNSTTSTHSSNPSRLMGMEAYYYILKNMREYGYGEKGFNTIIYESCEKFKDRLLTICAMNIPIKLKYKSFILGKKSQWYKHYGNSYFTDNIWKSKMMNRKQKIIIILYRFHMFLLIFLLAKIYFN